MHKFWFHNQIYLDDISAPSVVHQDLVESFLDFQLTLLYFLFVMKDSVFVFDFCALCKVKRENSSAKGLMEVCLGNKFKWNLS